MSKIFEQIKQDQLAMRKAKDPLAATLTTLIGEINNKAFGGKDVTDDVTIASIRALLKGLNEIIAATSATADSQSTKEVELLTKYLPPQLDVAEIKKIIIAQELKSIPDCQKYFAQNHKGSYSGKDVNEAFNLIG